MWCILGWLYPTEKAHYDLAKPGTRRLLPPEECTNVLQADYAHMQGMLLDTVPPSKGIMQCIQKMEAEINSLRQAYVGRSQCLY